MKKQDVQILYFTKLEARIMLHPYIKHLIGDINSGKTYDLQLIALLGYIVGTVCVNWLCMTNELDAHGFFKIDSSTEIAHIFYWIAIISTIGLIFLDFNHAFALIRTWKMVNLKSQELQDLMGYKSNPYHTDLSADKSSTLKRTRSMHSLVVQNTILETAELIICFLGKVTTVGCQFIPNDDSSIRDYLLCLALVLIWWEMYRKLLWLTIIPEYVVLYGLVIQRCMFAILQVISVAAIIAAPFILILVKISLTQGMTIYRDKDDESNLGQQTLFAVGHMFRLLTLDNYHDYVFEDDHAVFLSFFYPLAMSIFSLVVLNMCIAKLSIEYKDIIDNAQYEINRQRLYILVEWAIETVKAKRDFIITWEKIKAWLSHD